MFTGNRDNIVVAISPVLLIFLLFFSIFFHDSLKSKCSDMKQTKKHKKKQCISIFLFSGLNFCLKTTPKLVFLFFYEIKINKDLKTIPILTYYENPFFSVWVFLSDISVDHFIMFALICFTFT